MPAIWVVIPLYNKAPYIARCLASVDAQTFRDFEVIVVDDGSTDGSGEIAAAHLGSNGRLVHQGNAGDSAARQRGVDEAAADVCTFLDADDEWLPEHLSVIAELSGRFPEAGLFGSGLRRSSERRVEEVSLLGDEPRLVDYFAMSMVAAVINSSSAAVRRKALENVGGLFVGQHAADRAGWARVALRWPVALHPAVTSVNHQDCRAESVAKTSALRWHAGLVYELLESALASDSLDLSLRPSVTAFAAEMRLSQAAFLVGKRRFEEATAVLGHESLRTSGLGWRLRRPRLRARLGRCVPGAAFALAAAVRRRLRPHGPSAGVSILGDPPNQAQIRWYLPGGPG